MSPVFHNTRRLPAACVALAMAFCVGGFFRFKEKMERRKVNRLVETMTSQDPEGIKPDADMMDEAKAASHNGYVASEGFNDMGEAVQESTKSKPALYSRRINEEVETISQLLIRVSNE